MFNFNLSLNKKFKNKGINYLSEQLLNAKIADSLLNKKVKLLNFGIFHIGKMPYFKRLYFYPTTFTESIMMNSIYYAIKYNTEGLNINGLASSYYTMELHNKFILNKLVDTLKANSNPKSFIYAHLYMPHSPLQYEPYFSFRRNNSLVNYKAYWDFTNKELYTLLRNLMKENKYKIILTGDHGYRNDKQINPQYTFSAFYGFNKESIAEIKSVQDLGSLIYSCY